MTKLFIAFAIPIIAFVAHVVIVTQNLYPFGYPIKQGEIWELTWVSYSGTPIEQKEVCVVRMDSTYEGYVVRATCLNCNNGLGSVYSNGNTMRGILNSPTSAKLIKKYEK